MHEFRHMQFEGGWGWEAERRHAQKLFPSLSRTVVVEKLVSWFYDSEIDIRGINEP